MSVDDFNQVSLEVDGRGYRVLLRRHVEASPSAPRILVVTYMPNQVAEGVARTCVESLRKYTDDPVEIWVVDNCSPGSHREWLLSTSGMNVALNETQPRPPGPIPWLKTEIFQKTQREWGSYANAVGLEIGSSLISDATELVVTLHMDTMVTDTSWLGHLRSKLDDRTKAAGFRSFRNERGEKILHSLGMMFDYQLYQELQLSFFPDWPTYDVGDRITSEFQNQGYQIFSCPNTEPTPSVAERIPEESPFSGYPVDRALDDDGNVLFMHLGRAVVKSEGEYGDPDWKPPERWVQFAREHVI